MMAFIPGFLLRIKSKMLLRNNLRSLIYQFIKMAHDSSKDSIYVRRITGQRNQERITITKHLTLLIYGKGPSVDLSYLINGHLFVSNVGILINSTNSFPKQGYQHLVIVTPFECCKNWCSVFSVKFICRGSLIRSGLYTCA